MMQTAIQNFATQFSYKPVIEHKKKLKKKKRVIVLGMGGSHLAADLALAYDPSLPLLVWSDYGLPPLSKKELKESLIIASSYSGNTEEVLDGFKQALKLKLSVAVITVGGKLLKFAKQKELPHVQMPDTGIQPRSALGYSLLGILALMGQRKAMKEAAMLAKQLDPAGLRVKGRALAKKLKDHVPIVYSSPQNRAVVYNWKIKLNETGKIPAFYNVFSELNHNEMTGFDVRPTSKHLSERFAFVFLIDKQDHKKIQKRMMVMEKLYKKRKLKTVCLELTGKTRFERMFNSLLLADWLAVSMAELYGLESEQVPMVEEFKEMIV